MRVIKFKSHWQKNEWYSFINKNFLLSLIVWYYMCLQSFKHYDSNVSLCENYKYFYFCGFLITYTILLLHPSISSTSAPSSVQLKLLPSMSGWMSSRRSTQKLLPALWTPPTHIWPGENVTSSGTSMWLG